MHITLWSVMLLLDLTSTFIVSLVVQGWSVLPITFLFFSPWRDTHRWWWQDQDDQPLCVFSKRRSWNHPKPRSGRASHGEVVLLEGKCLNRIQGNIRFRDSMGYFLNRNIFIAHNIERYSVAFIISQWASKHYEGQDVYLSPVRKWGIEYSYIFWWVYKLDQHLRRAIW